jgi:hypothetical protein
VAQKTVVELVDDLDGGTAEETVSFALDGVEFQIDLSAENAANLRDILAPYIGHGRRTGGRKQRTSSASSRAPKSAGGQENQAIREWARSQGKAVAERGRLPQALVVQFQEAHSG